MFFCLYFMENFKEKISEAYGHFVQDRGKEPSIEQLIKEANCEESEFYAHFSNISSLRKGLWRHFADKTIERVQAEEVYSSYSAREKALSFFYTLIEVIKPFRYYVKYAFKHHNNFLTGPTFLGGFKQSYKAFSLELLAEGFETGELASRPFISDQYEGVLWKLAEFSLPFWVSDESEAYELTDTAIEKSVNVAFDFMAHGVFDSAFDFGKFILQYIGKKK